jgi:cytochrome b involved in lipid metabolism
MFKIKPFVTVTLFIFWAAVMAILTAGLVLYQANKGGIQSAPQAPGAGAPAGTSSVGSIVLSMQEIAKHNSAADCWMIDNNKVYDVTSAISAHPGGPGAITPYCGKDGTGAFQTKDRAPARNHSGQAYSWLDSLYIGNVGQAVAPAAVQNVKQAAPAAAGQYGGEYEDD